MGYYQCVGSERLPFKSELPHMKQAQSSGTARSHSGESLLSPLRLSNRANLHPFLPAKTHRPLLQHINQHGDTTRFEIARGSQLIEIISKLLGRLSEVKLFKGLVWVDVFFGEDGFGSYA